MPHQIIEPRQAELLKLVVENYISTAEPVSSKFLTYEKNIGWSEATVRNDLRSLEEAGYLTHPHTSAGRVPTELGYGFYVENIKYNTLKINTKDELSLSESYNQENESGLKNLAKEVAKITQEAVIVAFDSDRIFYTGLSSLFEKPEFVSSTMVINTSRMFDQCEECLNIFYDQVVNEPKIYIGGKHPFGSYLSVLALKFGENNKSLFIIFGPMRMNYKKNFTIISKINDLIK